MPAAVGEEPIARPKSQLPAAIAVLISAPLPISVQAIFPFTPSSNHFIALAIMVGLVSVKKPTFTVSGDAASARRLVNKVTAANPAVPITARRLSLGAECAVIACLPVERGAGLQ